MLKSWEADYELASSFENFMKHPPQHTVAKLNLAGHKSKKSKSLDQQIICTLNFVKIKKIISYKYIPM